MMWVFITFLAFSSQVLRNTFSKRLYEKIGAETVSFTRFLFGLPIVAIFYLLTSDYLGNVKILSNNYFIWIFVFSVTQIIANALLIHLFKYKNFAVSISFTKIEPVFVAIMASAIIPERLSIIGILGITISFLGIMFASLAKEKLNLRNIQLSFKAKSTYIGLLSGLLFAIAVIAIKIAFQYLEADNKLSKPIFTLQIALIIQSVIMLPRIYFKKRKEFKYIFKNPKIPFTIGLFSSLGSFFWFLAFVLAKVAYVRTFGQLEFVLSILISVYVFKEKISKNEISGMIFLIIGTILVLFA